MKSPFIPVRGFPQLNSSFLCTGSNSLIYFSLDTNGDICNRVCVFEHPYLLLQLYKHIYVGIVDTRVLYLVENRFLKAYSFKIYPKFVSQLSQEYSLRLDSLIPTLPDYHHINRLLRPSRYLCTVPFICLCIMPLFNVVSTNARADGDAAGASAFYPHTQRYVIPRDLFRKIREEATTGLTEAHQYSKLSLTFGEEKSGSANVQDAHTLSKTQQKALNHCRKFDMAEIFTEFPRLDFTDPENPTYDPTVNGTMNLFTSFDTISIDQVAATIVFMRRFSEDDLFVRIQDDLSWSSMFFLQSCSPNDQFRDEVHDTYNNIVDANSLTVGGPLVLRILLDKISNSDAVTLDALASSFKTTRISDIPGENVELLCKQLTSFLERLEMTGKLPNLLEISLCEIFQTSSTENFNNAFKHKKQSLFEDSNLFQWRDLVESAKSIYTRMNLVNEWNAPKDSGSFFQAGTHGDRRPDSRHNNGDASKTDPRFVHPNPKKGDQKLSEDPKRWSKTLDGQEVHWCSKCNQGKGRWTDGRHRHFTDQHRGGSRNNNASSQANAATTDQAHTGTSQDTGAASSSSTTGSFSAALTRISSRGSS